MKKTGAGTPPFILDVAAHGDSGTVEVWHRLYYSTLLRYSREQRFLGKDQAVMATVCIENPGLCLLVDAGSGEEGDPWLKLETGEALQQK